VYEWRQGEVSLISDGQSPRSSNATPAITPSGQDITFDTAWGLVPQDADGLDDIYDARIGGGFAPPAVSTACSGDACQGQPAGVPALPTAASVGFSGPGNAVPAAGGGSVRVRVTSRAVHGPLFAVVVRVPGRGRVTIAGAGIRTVHVALRRAGTFRIGVALTPRARSALRHRRRLRLSVRVSYAPTDGSASSVSVPMTDRA
jgi:hypothetical protein